MGGNDILDGFGGFDTLTGGFGADTFQIFASDYNANGFGYATITDFVWQQGDVLEIYSGGTAITSSFDPFFNATEIYSNNILIGVVQGSNFDFALDAVVSF